MQLDFSLKTDDLKRVQDRLGEAVSLALAVALYREAESILTDAKGQTPVETGILRDSGLVNLPVIKGGHVSVTLGFGGAASDYAVKVHEDLTLQHPHGNAKFLERPALEHLKDAPARIGAALRTVGGE